MLNEYSATLTTDGSGDSRNYGGTMKRLLVALALLTGSGGYQRNMVFGMFRKSIVACTLALVLLAGSASAQIIGGGIIGGRNPGNPLRYTPALWLDSSQQYCYTDAAIQFTASDKSWLQITDAAQTGLDPGTDDFLVCGWWYVDSAAPQYLFGKFGTVAGTGYYTYISSTGQIALAWSDGTVHYPSNAAAGTIGTGAWYFIAFHFDRNGRFNCWVGNTAGTITKVMDSDISARTSAIDNTSAFIVGRHTSLDQNYYNGRIDSLMVFKKLDLSAVASDIITWAYNSGAGRLCSEITAAQKTAWGAISGWDLGEACYDAETEVLTENGWKYFCEVERGEKVATLDPNTGIMNYDIPLEYHRYWHDGDMFQQKSRSIDLCVTPNHTMYVRKDKPRIVYDKNDSLSGFEKIQAKDMPLRVAYKRDAKWIGIERDFFILPEFTKEYTCTKNQTITRRENAVSLCNTRWGRTDVVIQEEVEPTTYTRVWDKKCIPMDTWLKFFGIWLAEGYTSKSKSGHHRIGISQSETANPENCREIERVLDELGYAYCRSGDGYEINDIQLYNYLAQFGKSYNKFIPKDIKELSPRQLHILFYGLQLGDGWNRREGSWGYGTCSQKLADDIQEISLKMGLVSVVTRKPFSEQPEYILGRKKKSGHDFYSLCITTRSKVRYVNAHGQCPEWVKYTGNVYCLTVPTGLLYVRRNGKSCWCGNSGRRYDSWGSNHLDQAFANIIQPPAYGPELLTNGNVETVTSAGPPANFGTWTEEITGTGNIEDETTILHGGSHAVKLTAGTGATDIYQSFTVVSGSTYGVELWTRGDGVNAGRYAIYHNSGYLVPATSTFVTGTNWAKVTFTFTATANGVAQLQLFAPAAAGGIAYFDDVSLKQITTAAINNGGFEDWTVPSAAELIVNGNFTGGITGWTNHATSGWNTFEAGTDTLHLARTGTPTTCAAYSTDFALVSGAVYRIRYTLTRTSGAISVTVAAAPLGASLGYTATYTSTPAAPIDTYFIATGTDAASCIEFHTPNANAADWTIDSVSITQVPSNATTWTETVAGTSRIVAESDAPQSGSYALRMDVDGSNSLAQVLISTLTVGKLYSYSLYAKASAGTPSLKVLDGALVSYSHTLTTSYASYAGTLRPGATNFVIARNSAALSSLFCDSVTITAAEILPAPGIVRGLCVDGDDLSYWVDRSGNGRHASIVTLAMRPIYQTNELNSLPILDFDGIDDRLETSLQGLQAATIFAVVKGGADGDGYVGVNDSMLGVAAGPVIAGVVANHTTATVKSNEDPTADYRVVCLSYAGDAAAESLHVDGTQEYAGTQSGAVAVDADTYTIGAVDSGGTIGTFGDCQIAAVIIYPSVLTTGQRGAVTAWLQANYALAP